MAPEPGFGLELMPTATQQPSLVLCSSQKPAKGKAVVLPQGRPGSMALPLFPQRWLELKAPTAHRTGVQSGLRTTDPVLSPWALYVTLSWACRPCKQTKASHVRSRGQTEPPLVVCSGFWKERKEDKGPGPWFSIVDNDYICNHCFAAGTWWMVGNSCATLLNCEDSSVWSRETNRQCE